MTTANDVLLYIPNLIGYTRVGLLVVSFILMIMHPSRWILGISFYVISFVGDLFDGMAARKYHQTSQFGGLLDMVTDRCATLGLLFILAGEYSYGTYSHFFRLIFLFLVILDISSHWCQMFISASFQKHHKSSEANADHFFLVRWYYQIYPFFAYCCVGTEFTYIALYVLSRLNEIQESTPMEKYDYSLHKWWWERFFIFCVPACVIKQLVNVSQLCSACHVVAKHDARAKDQ